MSKLITVNVNKKPAYDICLEKDFSMLKAKLVDLEYTGRRCCIVADSNTNKLYLAKLKKAIEGVFDKVVDYTFEAGEENIDICEKVLNYEQLSSAVDILVIDIEEDTREEVDHRQDKHHPYKHR